MDKKVQAAQKKVLDLFLHRCQVLAPEETVTSWGETLQNMVVLEEDIPCRFIKRGSQRKGHTGLSYERILSGLLLFGKEKHIPKGSLLHIALSSGERVTFRSIGEVREYLTHNAIEVEMETGGR